jgi:adenylate cyclase
MKFLNHHPYFLISNGLLLIAFVFFSFQIDRKQLEAQIATALQAKDYAQAVKTAIQLAESYEEANQLDMASKYYKDAINYANTSKDKKLQGYAIEKEGDFFLVSDNATNKKKNYQNAANLYKQANDNQSFASALKKLAKFSFEQKDDANTTVYAKQLLDNAGTMMLSEFEKLNLCKALITNALNKKNYELLIYALTNVDKVEKQAVFNSTFNPLTDIEEEILNKDFGKALAQASPEVQALLKKQESILTGKITQQDQSSKELNELKAAEAKWQKEIIAKQGELARLKDIENQRLIIGIIGTLLIFAVSIVALIGRQVANRKLAKQKSEIILQNKIIDEERKKAETLLLNILPIEIANELKEKGFFTDFKGFTQITEKLTPEQTVEKLNFFFQKFDEIAQKYNLEKIKTLGDGYMCAGGIPNENSTNPIDAVKAGLEMQKFMRQWNSDRIVKGEQTFELRLGINTGALVAGVIGKNKFAYDIWGDTVNLASRMESSGEIGKVNISGATYEWVRHQFECTHRGKVLAKNKGEIDMYFVEREIE